MEQTRRKQITDNSPVPSDDQQVNIANAALWFSWGGLTKKKASEIAGVSVKALNHAIENKDKPAKAKGRIPILSDEVAAAINKQLTTHSMNIESVLDIQFSKLCRDMIQKYAANPLALIPEPDPKTVKKWKEDCNALKREKGEVKP